MKILLYFEKPETIKTSGIGRAMRHQMAALTHVGVDFTIDPKDSYDLVHINTLFGGAKKLIKKCCKENIPAIVHGHSTFEDFRNSFRCWRLASLWFNNQIKYIYSRAGMIITPTPYSKRLIENYGYGKRVVAVSNGIELSEYANDENKVQAFKRHFNIKDGQKVVIGIGYPFPRKGIQDFLEVARSRPDITFIWFGHLQKILTQQNILRKLKHKPDNVILPGYIDNSIIKGAMQYASCLFFPSYEETEGIVVLEALASHLPVLVRRIGVYDEWLVENKNCLMGSSNEEFVSKIDYIISHDLSNMVNEGYKIVEERTLSKIGDQLKMIYEEFYNQYKK